MTTFEDIFEMLESVRTHKLGPGETIQPTNSAKGAYLGFATADTRGPATRWTISVEDLKRSCEARTSDEAYEVLRRMRSFQERRILLMDLRSGKLELEERPYTEALNLEEPTPSLKEETETLFRRAEEALPDRTGLAADPEGPQDSLSSDEDFEESGADDVVSFLDMLEG